MNDYDKGGFIPGHETAFTALGRCPLDGYALIVGENGEPEHVIPAAEIGRMPEAQRRIAAAHGSEVISEAEAITRGSGDE